MPLGHPPLFRITCLLVLCAICPSLRGADAPDSPEFFETHIRPVLVEHCYQCHSSDADEIGGSLLLDSAVSIATGGDSGPAIEPGNAEGSMLISAIRYESSEMPPEGKLPDGVINDFERWIAAGAFDPRKNNSPMPTQSEIDLDSGRQFWAFQPLRSSPPPARHDRRPLSTIDLHLEASLHQAGIEPNDLASPAARLRRLAFDLTGLPPDRQLQEQWLADSSPRHWSRIVDSMMASPAFGEHWARHWMDVARYADSNGSDFNATHHEAWRYREYLIRSFATDRPLDQMIRQQIAGDLLPSTTDVERYDNVVASTFLMLGTKMLSERDKSKLTMDVVDEQIDTVGRAFLGLTLGCARCHDHKFDPIPTEDYYALAGIFKSSVTLKGESQKYVSTWNRVPLPTSEQHRADVKNHAAELKSLAADIKKAEQSIKTLQKQSVETEKGIVVDDTEAEKLEKLQSLKQQLDQLKSQAPEPLPEAMAPSDRPTDQIADSPVHIRGEVQNFGEVIPRGFLQACSGGAANRDPQGSGRLGLADWLTDPDNPLVARVFVNRVWMHLMGEGLVRTVDNFGLLGERPTHPELLDELATQFVRKGWHVKPLVRKIVTSQAYNRSTEYNVESIAADPENRLMWRAHRRRLAAESVRDAMLLAAGSLDRSPRFEPMRGRGVLVSSNNGDSTASFDDVSQACRSIYLPIVRGYMPPLMTALDVADPDLLTGRRPTTNVPSQALVLINSPDVDSWARMTAQRVTTETSKLEDRLNLAFMLCLQRKPNQADRMIAGSLFGEGDGSIDDWHQYIAAIFAGTEFRLLD